MQPTLASCFKVVHDSWLVNKGLSLGFRVEDFGFRVIVIGVWG